MYGLRQTNGSTSPIKSPNKNKPRQLCIGIITMPHMNSVKYGTTHIMKTYVDWFEQKGVRVVAIPYTTTEYELYFNNVNGILIPGGEHDYVYKNKKFIFTCAVFLELSTTSPDIYFPIWGTCLGHQMIISIVGNIRNFGKYNAVGNYPIELTKYGNKSRMFGEFSRSFIEMLGNPDEGGGTLNNHHHGLSPEEFSNNYRLRGFLKINAIGQDINKKQFVAAIEARYWPIYGVQWHPERQGDLGQPFVEFFISELSKNKHICQTIPVSISSKKKPRPCIQYPELTDQLCYFFKE